MKSSIVHGVIVTVVGFVAMYGLTLVHLVPQNIQDLTVGSLLSGLVALIGHYNS